MKEIAKEIASLNALGFCLLVDWLIRKDKKGMQNNDTTAGKEGWLAIFGSLLTIINGS